MTPFAVCVLLSEFPTHKKHDLRVILNAQYLCAKPGTLKVIRQYHFITLILELLL
ncbi:hypothetical protein VCRA2128O305_310048 [Vibrio crassostreae]|nr:hypothetical protein VCRA2112O187_140016 [Vibrio crassostreae]CAK1921455.1 hypothetical protein VCRA2112O185_220014 [Vibrio crassostreae]CAK1928743.1 hypothetical protein VCRA2112E186_230080 [Vibrio crassostreae]CAK1935251.1 hypothetical protein VCRA2118O239_240057 [Vibrio crassostreae]CAK1943264.1 hypothetical protein VCRA2113O202_250014 [Vibrio crassostreae]